MGCADMTTGSEIGAVNAGEFWYLLCPYESAFGSQIGFAVVILGIIAVAIAIQNKSVVPALIWGIVGGSAIILQSNIEFGLYSQILYIGTVVILSIAIYTLLRRISRS
tara:strand:+ start:2542 stop:2865 length:324 start_codon:yes stop_codon:yes gene_type:complete